MGFLKEKSENWRESSASSEAVLLSGSKASRQESGTSGRSLSGSGCGGPTGKPKNLVWQFEVMGHERSDDNTWHELRKSAKALGYQLRLLKPIWPKMMNVSVDEIDQLTDRLGDANDLAILHAKILNQPYDPSETQESAEIRRIFLQMLDRRKQKLQSEAFKLAKLVYAEKPGQFERRLATYWRVGQGSLEVSKTTYSGHDQEDAKGASSGKRKQKPWYPYLYHRRLRQS